MENASKALLMAGGILIAIIIISLLLIMFNQIGNYQKSQNNDSKEAQLAAFNRDFERYTEDEIKGVDIISLINKVHDYNTKQEAVISGTSTTTSTYIDYNIKIELTVSGLYAFNDKYAYANDSSKNQLFTTDSFLYNGTNSQGNSIKQQLDNFANAEGSMSISTLKKLTSIYDPSKNKSQNIENIKAKLIEIDSSKYKDWNGTSPAPTLDTIKKYRQYSEFKSDKFVVNDAPKYKNGQIYSLSFKYQT